MVKVISKIGNSQGLIMDQALLELAHLKVGDLVNIEVHDGGTISITPLHLPANPTQIASTIPAVMKDYEGSLKRLE